MNDITLPVQQQIITDKNISDQLRQRLDMVDKLEEALQDMTDKYNGILAEKRILTNELESLRQLDLKQKALDDREKLIDSREKLIDMRQDLNAMRIENAEQRVTDHINMVTLIFRNSELRRHKIVPIAINSSTPVMNPDGTYSSQQCGYVSKEEVEEKEMVE